MKVKNLIEWANAVRKRDNYTCQECGKAKGRMMAHHIKERKLFSRLALEVSNGTTLCTKCHGKEPRQLYLFERVGIWWSRDGWWYPKRVRGLAKNKSSCV